MANENNHRIQSINRDAVLTELIGLGSAWRSARSDMPDQAAFCWREMKQHCKRLRALLPEDPELVERIEDCGDVQRILETLDELERLFGFGVQNGSVFWGPDPRQVAILNDVVGRFTSREAFGNLTELLAEADSETDGCEKTPCTQLVTLIQMASMVNRTKRALEGYKTKMPLPAVEGGGGRPAEWNWSEVRPWLEEKFHRSLPDIFPGDRFQRQ